MADDIDPIAWTAIPRKHPVRGADGATIGHVSEVLGDPGSDIFHGIVLAHELPGRPDPQLELTADHITDLNVEAIETDLDVAGLETLPAYTEQHEYHRTAEGGLIGRLKDRLDGIKGWESDH